MLYFLFFQEIILGTDLPTYKSIFSLEASEIPAIAMFREQVAPIPLIFLR
jgi:hypothetical protein